MKKEKVNKCERKYLPLLQAEVYVRFPVRVGADGKKETKYTELQRTPAKNGIIENYVEVDYPVTADSLNSYADSVDYRKNPDVVTRAVPRQNLGDVTEMQKIAGMDSGALQALADKMKAASAKIEEYVKQKQNSSSETETEVEENGETV